MSKPKEQEPRKIVLIGLDNSGKTSILLSLQGTTNILSFFSLKPTLGLNIIKIEEEGKEYTIWELGGQQKYRKKYLEDLDKYTQGADEVIFVIDVQATDRYELALQYLADIFRQLKKDEIEFSIYFHKFDPDLEKIKRFSTEQITSILRNRINSIIPPDYNYEIFKTTIYTIFQKTQLNG
ncbi:MAG: GTP-binding protein [Candidatus Helarchaeota archaeon]|nr:GTP-binding protein [Candidatus Helarchaeota archaeon]